MDPQHWQRIQTHFDRLVDVSADARADALLDVPADLRDELTDLLAAHDATDAAIDTPAAGLIEVAATDDDLLHATLGPYSLTARLGAGGMGVVYLGEYQQADVSRKVAVKVIKRGMDTEHIVARFRAEQRILATLDHAGVARLLDVGFAPDGRPYLVMEYVDGVPIDEWCRSRDLPLDARLRLFQEVCRAVHHAHRSLVVHRDLKPSNILVTPEGRIKLLDFGIAKLLDPDPDHGDSPVTVTGLMPMTPEFASPEQVEGGVVTTAVDVYGLGVLLFLLLTDRHAHRLDGDDRASVLAAVTADQRPRPSEAAPDRARRLRGDLDLITQTAMHPDPGMRYGSALALAEDLERHRHGRPVYAHRDSWLYSLGKFVRRNRAAVTVGAIALLASLGFGVVMALQARDIASQAAQIRLERDRAEQVQTLVMDMFDLTDPLGDTAVQGDTLSVRDFLQLNQVTLLDRLDDQPDLQARFAHLLARLQGNLGRYEEALPLVEQSLVLRRQLHSGDHSDLASSLDYLGSIQQNLGRYEDAGASFRQALAMRRRLFGEQHREVAESLNNMSAWLMATEQHDSSLAYDQAALAVRRAVLGDRDPETVQSLNNLGAAMLNLDRPAEAEPLLREALTLRRELLGPQHPYVANTTNNLARTLVDLDRVDEAIPLFHDALDIWRRVLGPDHPRLGGGYYNLALAFERQGDLAAAAAAMQASHASDVASYPQDHPYVAESGMELGRLFLALDRPEDARPSLQLALTICEARHGTDHDETRRVRALLERCDQQQEAP